MRQRVAMDPEGYRDFYRTTYHDPDRPVYTHSYEHDRSVARARLAEYGLASGVRLLDVGAGNGAFVDEAVERGIDAWGHDLDQHQDHERTYRGPLEGAHFPTDHFDVVTAHDVLEHVPRPLVWLRELRRTLKADGTLIVDFPRFHHPSGRHHWKPVEHLWLLDDTGLVGILTDAGFRVTDVRHPIESKTVIYAEPREREDVASIIVPPGIGDTYWVMAKLQGWLERKGIRLPDIYVHGRGPKRTEPFVRRIPFVRFAGHKDFGFSHPVAREAYGTGGSEGGRCVIPDVFGCDWLISFNAALNRGDSLDDAMPDVPTDWYLPLFRSLPELRYRDAFREEHGPYVLVFLVDKGWYGKWTDEFNESALLDTLNRVHRAGRTVVFTGAEWDRDGLGHRLARKPQFVDMVGETSFEELTALLDGADCVFGMPAGNTLLAPMFGTPTVLLWNRHFPEPFWTNTVPPDSAGRWYHPVETRGAGPREVARLILETKRTMPLTALRRAA